MRNSSRILILLSLLIGFVFSAISYAQAEQTIVVTPNTGEVGTAVFEVHVTGLLAGETYSVEFVYKGAVVSASDEVADEKGEITFSGGSQDDDEAGTYTVQVVDADSVIADTQFILTAASDDKSSENEATDTPNKPSGTMVIEPASGIIGTVHHIVVSDLTPNASYTVEVMADASEEMIYRRIWKSSGTGTLTIEIFAQEGDTPGIQTVTVYNNADGSIVAQSHFTIDAPTQRNATVTISPTNAPAGDKFTIQVEGLKPFDKVSARITSASNQLIDTVDAIATSNGTSSLTYVSSDELADGSYTVTILVDGQSLTTSQLTIGEAQSPSPILLITPQSATRGSRHVVTVTNLSPNQAFTLIVKNSAGETAYTTDRTADAKGDFSMNITSSDSDEFGTYDLLIMDGDKSLASSTFTIEGGDEVAEIESTYISIVPDSGASGTTYTILIAGVPVDKPIGVVIRAQSDNSLLYSGVFQIDENGNGVLDYPSSENAKPDTYNVIITQPSGRLAQATLTIEGAIASLDPLSAPKGSSFSVSVRGLNANEKITFDVQLNGESVYSSDKTASADGEALLELKTNDSDEVGDYTVTVIRDEGYQPSVTLSVTDTESSDTNTEENDSSTEATSSTETISSDTSEVYEASLNAETPIDQFTFSGQKGDYVIIALESEDFDPVLTLLDKDQLQVAYNDDFNGTNSQVGPYRLPYTGEYSAMIDQVGGFESVTPGNFKLTVRHIKVSEIEFGEDVAFALDTNTPASYYQFTVNAGDVIDIDVSTGGSIDTMLNIIDSEGYSIVSDDDSGDGFDPELTHYIFDSAGLYILNISTFASNETGEGTVSVTRSLAKSLDEGVQTIRLNDKQSRDYVVFDGAQGDVMMLNMHRISGMVDELTISAFVGDVQIAIYDTVGIADDFPLVFVMPMDGQVLLKFEKYSYQDGISFEVSLGE